MSADTQEVAHVGEPQPPGEFQWTPQWRRLLPAWRSRETPPTPAPLAPEACLAAFRAGVVKARARLGGSPTVLGMLGAANPEALFELPPEWLAGTPVLADWSLLCGRVMLGSRQFFGEALTAAAVWRLAAAAHGLPFAVELLLDAVQTAPPLVVDHSSLVDGAALAELRARCAAAPADSHAGILAVARAQAPRSGLLASLAAHLLPDEEALVAQALSGLGANAPSHAARPQLLAGCLLTPAQFEHLLRHYGRQLGIFETTRELLLNAARLKLPQSFALALQRADKDHYADHRRPYFEIARAHDTTAALAALFERFADKDARPLLDPFAHAWPQLAIRLAAERCVATGDAALREWLQRFAAAQRDALRAAQARADDAIRPLLDGIAGRLGAALVEAPEAELPHWLRAPPWRADKRPAKPRWPALPAPEIAPQLAWQEGERARWQGTLTPESLRANTRIPAFQGLQSDALVAAALRLLGVPDSAHARVLAGERIERAGLDRRRSSMSGFAMLLPPLAARALLWSWGAEDWYQVESSRLEQVVAWLDALAVPMLEDFAEQSTERGLQLAQPLASARVALVAANALRTSKKARPLAQAWLLRHAPIAAAALLPLLGGRKGAEDAGFALRWLLANGREAALESAAAGFGAHGQATLAALRAFDPLNLAPPKPPQLADFWLPAGWPRPLLRDGRALPATALDAIGEMLAFSPLEPRYAGLSLLRELCEERSLGAFAWALFEAWLTAGAPAKAQWAFSALAHLGDDECARQLAKRIRAWPTEGASGRAANGLDLLAAMESEVALMLLFGIAQKVKSKPLQAKAQARLEQLALVRGLSAEELADRLVPDLGLDEDGSLRLDFGPRQFTVGFDEHLKPQVREAGGALLKDLPAPAKGDDASLAEAAVARFKALRKDARTLASQQIARLEQAMVQGRRWSAGEFRRLFVEHPLLRHLVRRLLWARCEDGRVVQGLRVAEDLSYADAGDAPLVLADEAQVGLAHPLQLAPAELAAFHQIFADYEIAQPFAQLGREVYRLAPEEQQAFELARLAGRKVATGSLLGLESRGWQRGDDGDGGMVHSLMRSLGPDLVARIECAPGYAIGDARTQPAQTLENIELRRSQSWGEEGRLRWGEVDAVLASEVLRDIERLARAG